MLQLYKVYINIWRATNPEDFNFSRKTVQNCEANHGNKLSGNGRLYQRLELVKINFLCNIFTSSRTHFYTRIIQ